MKSELTFGLALAALFSVPASAGGCEGLIAALVKGTATPWHSSLSTVTDGKPELLVETVTLADKVYVKDKSGTWKSKIHNRAGDEARIRRDWTNGVCTAAGTETIDGETADIVSHRSFSGPGFAIELRFWISQASGLVLKTTMSRAKSNFTIVYDYRDIAAPD